MKFFTRQLNWLTGLAICGVLGGMMWLYWLCDHNASVCFFPQNSPAGWIIYLTPPTVDTVKRVPLETEFRRTFELADPVTNAVLRVAAFQDFSVSLNGVTLEHGGKHSE